MSERRTNERRENVSEYVEKVSLPCMRDDRWGALLSCRKRVTGVRMEWGDVRLKGKCLMMRRVSVNRREKANLTVNE